MNSNILPYNSKLIENAKKLRKHCTLAEVLLWNQIKNKKLGYKFRRQVPIENYIVDFYCPQLRLIIEIDGSSHGDKIEYDQKREQHLKLLNVKIIKFTDTDIKQNIEGVMRKIKEILP